MNRTAALGASGALAFLSLAVFSGKPAAAGRRPGFVDVAPRSKFAYKTNNSSRGRKYFPQPMCGGVAIFDFDNDGKLDIFFTNGAQLPDLKKTDPSYYNCLLHQKSDGTFEDVTVRAGLTGEGLDYNFGVAVGDYDNDGREDLFVCGAARNVLYHNNGDGTFTDVTAESGIGGKPENTLSVAAAWFDYDNDGLLDLIVSNYTFWTPKLDFRCTMDSKDYYCDPRRYPSVPARLYHNLGNGKFVDVTAQAGFAASPGKGMGISIADFNGDGRPDVFIANDTEPNSLFINQGNGRFEEKGLEMGVAYDDNAHTGSSMGCDAKDFDNDGKVDIFYNNLVGQIWALLRNRGAGLSICRTSRTFRSSAGRSRAGATVSSITTTTAGRISTRRTETWTRSTRSLPSMTRCSKTSTGNRSWTSPGRWARISCGRATSAARPSGT